MLCARLLAGVSFLGLVFAAGGTLRLAIAESVWRMGPIAGWPLSVGNASHYDELAEREPALAGRAWRSAVSVNPRDSAAWIALGLEAERAGDMDEAARCLLEAEKVDRQYLPAWTSANFFFRRANDAQFWRAAVRAAALSYDDPAPLIALADHREPRASAALERLGETGRLERGYLRFLIGESRWREAQEVAARLASRQEAGDTELLLNFTGRLIAAGKGEAALAVWNDLQRFPALDRAGSGVLVNGNFRSQPSGQGFDWRVTAPPGGSAHWEPARLRFWLAGSTPDACGLLEQWVVLTPGRYRLRFAYRTEGLAEETGLRWMLAREAREVAVSPVLAQATASGGRKSEWSFGVVKAGLFQLRLVYNRVPGTTHIDGRAEFGSVGLEIL